jgi:hypothetical protein
MKKQVLALVGVLSLFLAAGSAFAQTDHDVRASVPFNFVVGKTTMPSGNYQIVRIGMSSENIAVRALGTKSATIVLTGREQVNHPSDRTKLVFHRYGDRYFLSQIWVEGSDRMRTLPKSNLEKEIALDWTPNNVVLFASAR